MVHGLLASSPCSYICHWEFGLIFFEGSSSHWHGGPTLSQGLVLPLQLSGTQMKYQV